MITKKQLDELYAKPRDPLKPFERLEKLMEWAIHQLKKDFPKLETND